MNIMKLGMQYLGPIVVQKIASSMGIQSPLIQKAIAAALPTILAALTGRAVASNDNATSMFGLLQNTPDMAPDAFESGLGSMGDMAANGAGLLTSLIGSGQADEVAAATANYAGIAGEQSGQLMGLLGPAVAGMLKGQVAEQGLDAAGLASFLGDQKANIAAEMPADFLQHMQGSSLMSSLSSQFPDLGQGMVGQAMDAAGDMVGGAAGMAGDAVGAAGDAVAGAAGAATDAAASAAGAAGDAVSGAAGAARDTAQAASGGMGGILKFLIPLLILAGLVWYFMGGGKTPEVAMPDVSPELISVGDVNLGEQFTGITDGLTSALGGITDADSATAALPQLEGISEQVGSLEGLVGQLGDEGKGAFGGIVQAALGTIQPLIEKAIGAAGEGSPVAGILNGIVEKLLSMAG